jgi:hypothetical protein
MLSDHHFTDQGLNYWFSHLHMSKCPLGVREPTMMGSPRMWKVFKVKVLRENKVILLIDVWVYIPSEQLPLRRLLAYKAVGQKF